MDARDRSSSQPLSYWPLAISWCGLLAFAYVYFVKAPLPFFGYFSDPEVAYILSALQLNEFGYVQMTDHPGTFLQITGAAIARVLGFRFDEAFELSAYNQFRLAWLIMTLALTASAFYLIWKQAVGSLCIFLGALLLLFHDYNTLMHFGRFSPEGGFIALYLIVVLFACRSVLRGGSLSCYHIFGWGFLIGAVTTIKITLWPVSAFILGAFLCFRTDFRARRQIVQWVVLLLCAMLSYGVLGSVFADDPSGQWTWFLSLVTESGRYGHVSEEGSFLSLSQIFNYTIQGFSLQSYTTLFPICTLSIFAIWDVCKGRRIDQRLLSAGFLCCLILSFLIYAKHPYQIKYLLPQTYLFLAYFILRTTCAQADLSSKMLRYFVVLLCLVALNAGVNFHIVHKYNLNRYTKVEAQVDRLISEMNPSQLYFSLEVPSKYTTHGIGVREIPDFQQLYTKVHTPLKVFRERSQDYKVAIGQSLPLTEISSGSVVFTKRYFKDARVELVWYDEELGLFAYRAL